MRTFVLVPTVYLYFPFKVVCRGVNDDDVVSEPLSYSAIVLYIRDIEGVGVIHDII